MKVNWKTVIIKKNGETKMRVPAYVVNGVLRVSDGNILINSALIPAGQEAKVKAALQARHITPEIEAMGIKLGDNGNGLVAVWQDDDIRAERAAMEPALVERARISEMHRKAHKALNHDTDDNNVVRGYSLQAAADKMLAAWQAKYPEHAKRERAQDMLAEARELIHTAQGALTYDCDGSISPDEQMARHSQLMAEARELKRQAEAMLA